MSQTASNAISAVCSGGHGVNAGAGGAGRSQNGDSSDAVARTLPPLLRPPPSFHTIKLPRRRRLYSARSGQGSGVPVW